MAERDDPASGAAKRSTSEGLGEALRAAVERTLGATAGSATETRQRAQELLDDVARRGHAAREEVARRGEEATTRLAEAISELRRADRDELGDVLRRLEAVERRLARLEDGGATEAPQEGESNPRVEDESRPGADAGP